MGGAGVMSSGSAAMQLVVFSRTGLTTRKWLAMVRELARGNVLGLALKTAHPQASQAKISPCDLAEADDTRTRCEITRLSLWIFQLGPERDGSRVDVFRPFHLPAPTSTR